MGAFILTSYRWRVEGEGAKSSKSQDGHTITMFEVCCSDDPTLGQVNAERNIDHIRLTKSATDVADNAEANDLLTVVDLWASIPQVNLSKRAA